MIASIQRGFAGAFGGNGRRSKNIAVVGEWGVGSIHEKSKGRGPLATRGRPVFIAKAVGGIRMHREKKGETK
jgi:hypothetical protein